MAVDEESVVDHSLAERRRYKREQVELAGRQFEPEKKREADCKIVNLSPGGARILSDVVPPRGTLVVIYIDHFGRFEGNIVRVEQGGFGIQFSCTEHKHQRIAEQLLLYKNGALLEETALRRHDRTLTKGMLSFTRPGGAVVKCRILDFSRSGVFLETGIRPPVGEFVLIDQVPGRIARHSDSGIAIEYMPQAWTDVELARPKLLATG